MGSTVIAVNAEDLRKTGANATSDLLLKVPQFVALGQNEANASGGTSHEPYRIVVFRRPIELRAERSGSGLAWLVRSALVLELADVLALSPEQIDPDFDVDDD